MTTASVERLQVPHELNDAEVWRYMHTKRTVDTLSEQISWARGRALELGQPQVARRRLAVERLDPDGIALEDGVKLESEGLLKYFQGAETVMLIGITIGPQVEEEVDRLFGQGEPVKALVLDAAGSALLDKAGGQVHREAFVDAQSKGLRTGPCLGPGGAFWDLTGQRTFFRALPLESMGLRLLKSFFMCPRKSNTRVLPMGKDLKVESNPDESHCRYCSNRYCLARRE
jgi:hypothetical protein